MNKIIDVHIKEMIPLISPKDLKKDLAPSPKVEETVLVGRQTIQNILDKKDKRMLVITGPCSIHEETAALEYAEKLNALMKKVESTMVPIMRLYFEKPRTTVGWKGMINDPHMDGSHDITAGLKKARTLLLKINEMGLPAGTEMLDPITPQYIAGLITWVAIGARTTESQTHREMASGLSMPIGFKNGTDGTLTTAINALKAAGAKQSFLGIDHDGYTCIVNTTGNPWGHIVLRGGKRPNYDPVSIADARKQLRDKGLREAIIVDCSHANSGKRHQGQTFVWKNVIDQRLEGDDSLVGLMLESFIHEGNQKITENMSDLKYGVSVTDECISWETTEKLILGAHEKLGG